MSMTVGGSNGVTYPNSTNTSAATVSSKLAPALTDVGNVLSISYNVIIDGTNGLYANGTVYTTAP